ncbi:ribonuclease Z [Zobellella aerophila]|uniref:Ribonuclease Z n=1 Tax=Zobellella aerophila TaxID=870480 RepID=A0ABP6V995_9GAMM
MDIIFLGTSSGTPTKTRNLSGVALRKAGSKPWFLIDCGEGTQHRLLHTNLSLNSLQAVCITHVHGDHCYGLPGLLASATMSGRSAALTIIGPAAIREFIEATQKATQLRLSYPVNFVDVAGMSGVFDGDGFDIDAVALSHRVPSFAYVFVETGLSRKLDVTRLKADAIESGPVWGQLQRGEDVILPDGRVICSRDYLLEVRKPRKVIISGDNDTPALLAESAKSAHVLVHEATYTEAVAEKVGAGPRHSSAKAVAQFAAEAAIANLILTHFSPRYKDSGGSGLTIGDIELEARTCYAGNLLLANDLDMFHLDRAGTLIRR